MPEYSQVLIIRTLLNAKGCRTNVCTLYTWKAKTALTL